MNIHVGFRVVFDAAASWPATMAVTAASVYRVWVNGRFVGYGPARTAHGWARVDVWPLRARLQTGANLVAIEVAGYNVNGQALIHQPSFLQAEIMYQGHVLASTHGEGVRFTGVALTDRVQRVQRYSPQRSFVEVYRLGPGFDIWRRDMDAELAALDLEVMPARTLLPRAAPLPRFEFRVPLSVAACGRSVEREAGEAPLWRDRSLTEIGPHLRGFSIDELDSVISDELCRRVDVDTVSLDDEDEADPELGISLAPAAWTLFDFGANQTGFIGLQVRCRERIRLYALFDERRVNGELDFLRLNTVNAVTWQLEPGEYALETIEPYTLRYLKVLSLDGACEVDHVYVRELACPDADSASFLCSDPALEDLFEAGRETFRQTGVDILMNGPSRERAGWLCDSFFMGRAEKLLRGVNTIEHDFLENYVLPERFEHLPEGMMPMCYPADNPEGFFSPSGPLWLILELAEYRERTGDTGLVAAFRDKVMALLRTLDAFVNDDGLLENLPDGGLTETFRTDDLTQGVHYPVNMIWAAALEAAGTLYGQPELHARAETARQAVRAQSFDGEYFVDHARRDAQGRLERTAKRTETCQYVAFYFNTASPVDYPELWNRVLNELGPQRADPDPWADVQRAAMLPGLCLRMALLARAGQTRQMCDELKGAFLNMARTTGTLWEHDAPTASCAHGLAAHVVCWLFNDILGCRIDEDDKLIRLTLRDTGLQHATGVVPVADGAVRVQWRRIDDRLTCRVEGPPGYRVETENHTGLNLVALAV